MKVREYYYEEAIIEEIKKSFAFPKNKTSDRLYSYFLKRNFQAQEVAIDYERKIAYLQYHHSTQHTDDRLTTASSKIVELHFSSMKQLLLTCIKRQRTQKTSRKIAKNSSYSLN
ncbi:hypothetical protein [Mesonia maritima]|uniref:Uncharacterized protein n=1 Tax=Mesonia maritima TaxID=1793873 RepID=A0ABU1K3Q7_9FLAO|nr:hypothetical protein [Mesonia maritima]MDR6300236.1 hypothetical protein [Mesonia maritima]